MIKKGLSFFIIFSSVAIVNMVLYALAFCKEINPDYNDLKSGVSLLKEGRYEDSLRYLRNYLNKKNPVNDMVLFYMACAERGLNRLDESNVLIKRLLEDYPESALLKRAKAIEARNNISILGQKTSEDRESIENLISDYLSSYPDDHEVTLLYARYLKARGEVEKAKALFIKVYKVNSQYSEEALKELNPSDISAGVLVEKASNLIKDMEYKKAEALLRKALRRKDRTIDHEEILKKLGYSLFMQKRYEEAATEYIKAGDIYDAARAYFRAGELKSFDKLLSRLREMKDRRAGLLILAKASRMRREGDIEGALRLYEAVKEDYPLLKEESLWGIAWTYYRAGRYDRSLDLLFELSKSYPSKRYDYWKKRCQKRLAGDSNEKTEASQTRRSESFDIEYGRLDHDPDYYGLLEYIADIDRPEVVRLVAESNRKDGETRDRGDKWDGKYSGYTEILERFQLLLYFGFRTEAIKEILSQIKKSKRPDIALVIAYSLQEDGFYGNAIRIIKAFERDLRAINKVDFMKIYYPLAFWPTVRSVSEGFDIDPYLLLSVMREESRFEPEARSSAGALGVMQLMPSTAERLVRKTGLSINGNKDLRDVRLNTTVGAYYLKELIKEFGSISAAIAAYNAGEERVREWLKKGAYRSPDEFIEDIPFDETRNYVKRVLTTYVNYLSLRDYNSLK